MAMEIVLVKSQREWNEFKSLDMSRCAWTRELLNVDRNPYFSDAFMRPILVRDQGKPVARAVGFFDKRKIHFSKVPVVTFDFVVAGKSPEADRALWGELETWARGWGARVLRGPVATFWDSTTGASGDVGTSLLVAGFQPVANAQIFSWDVTEPLPPAIEAKALMAKTNPLVKIRELKWESPREREAEALRVVEVYNEAWRDAWNHVPLRAGDVAYWLKTMTPWMSQELLWIVEVQGEPAALALCVPAHAHAVSGWDALKWRVWEKNPFRGFFPRAVRGVVFGVRSKFKYLGLSALLAWQMRESLSSRGFDRVVSDPVLSDRTAALKFFGQAFKNSETRDKRQVYEKILS